MQSLFSSSENSPTQNVIDKRVWQMLNIANEICLSSENPQNLEWISSSGWHSFEVSMQVEVEVKLEVLK